MTPESFEELLEKVVVQLDGEARQSSTYYAPLVFQQRVLDILHAIAQAEPGAGWSLHHASLAGYPDGDARSRSHTGRRSFRRIALARLLSGYSDVMGVRNNRRKWTSI